MKNLAVLGESMRNSSSVDRKVNPANQLKESFTTPKFGSIAVGTKFVLDGFSI